MSSSLPGSSKTYTLEDKTVCGTLYRIHLAFRPLDLHYNSLWSVRVTCATMVSATSWNQARPASKPQSCEPVTCYLPAKAGCSIIAAEANSLHVWISRIAGGIRNVSGPRQDVARTAEDEATTRVDVGRHQSQPWLC